MATSTGPVGVSNLEAVLRPRCTLSSGCAEAFFPLARALGHDASPTRLSDFNGAAWAMVDG